MAALCSLQLLPEVLPKNLWALTNSATVFEGEKTWLPFKIESIQANSQSRVLTIRSLSVEKAAQFPVHSDFSWVPWPLWKAASDRGNAYPPAAEPVEIPILSILIPFLSSFLPATKRYLFEGNDPGERCTDVHLES